MLKRLTFRKPDGTCGIAGVDVKSLDNVLYSVFWKLKEYEDTGYSPDFIDTISDILLDIKQRLEKSSDVNVKNCITAIDFILKSKEKDR